MEFIVDKNTIVKAFSKVQGIVEKKVTHYVLENVLILANKKNSITIFATNLDIGLHATYSANVTHNGGICLPGRKFYEIVREMPEGSVNIKVIENSQVEISKDKIRFKMKGLPEEEYPKTVEYEDAYFIQIKMNDFIDLVNRTVFIIPQDRSSNSVNGAKIEFLDEDGKYKIRMVSTDGYRLACVDRNVEISACPPESAIIPRKALLEIKRLSEDAEEEEIKIGFSNGNCIVMLNDFIMNMRILSGEFPQYKEIIPQNFRYEFIILRSALLSALRRISLITERTGFVTYIFSENSLRLFGSDPHLGEVSEEITLDYYGEDITTAFNARLMLDILGNIECEEICFKFVDSNTPAMILPKEYEGFFYLIMPISVEDILEDKIESAFSDEQSECVEEGDR